MNDSTIMSLGAIWDRFVLITDQSPRSIFAALLAVLTLLVSVAIITMFSRLRSLKYRNRQLAESIEALSALLEGTRTDFEAKIYALSVRRERPDGPAPARADKDRELPVALMREELASLQMDLRASEEREETATSVENA